MVAVTQGRLRSANDGFRRYLPTAFSFDTRAWLLATEIGDDWEDSVKEQWRQNKQTLREQIIHQYGAEDYDRKIEDFTSLGQAPWSVIAPHVRIVRDVRCAFVAGAHYSALLGAAGLGERILNDLVLRLRSDFEGHAASSRVVDKDSFNDWRIMIEALNGWGVLDDDTAKACKKFAKLRHEVVHYRQDKDIHVRTAALQAVEFLTTLISHVFSPHGGSPRFIAGTSGQTFISLGAESDPVVKHYFIPNSALVSPRFAFTDGLASLLDENDYGEIHNVGDLTDEEFAARFASSA